MVQDDKHVSNGDGNEFQHGQKNPEVADSDNNKATSPDASSLDRFLKTPQSDLNAPPDGGGSPFQNRETDPAQVAGTDQTQQSRPSSDKIDSQPARKKKAQAVTARDGSSSSSDTDEGNTAPKLHKRHNTAAPKTSKHPGGCSRPDPPKPRRRGPPSWMGPQHRRGARSHSSSTSRSSSPSKHRSRHSRRSSAGSADILDEETRGGLVGLPADLVPLPPSSAPSSRRGSWSSDSGAELLQQTRGGLWGRPPDLIPLPESRSGTSVASSSSSRTSTSRSSSLNYDSAYGGGAMGRPIRRGPPLPMAKKEEPPDSPFLLAEEDPEKMEDDSTARLEWLRHKREFNEKNEALDKIMCMVGLEDVKMYFLNVKARVETAKARDKTKWRDELRLDLVLWGGLGTGKKTIGRIYADFLESLDVVLRDSFVVMSTGVLPLPSRNRSKVFFFNKVHKFVGGLRDVDATLHLSEDKGNGTPILVYSCRALAGGHQFAASPDARWRLPTILKLPDYSDEELHGLLIRLFKHRSLVVEGGFEDVCMRVAVKRAARGRGTVTHGNARTIQAVFEKILNRQAVRLRQEWFEWELKKREKKKAHQERAAHDLDAGSVKEAATRDKSLGVPKATEHTIAESGTDRDTSPTGGIGNDGPNTTKSSSGSVIGKRNDSMKEDSEREWTTKAQTYEKKADDVVEELDDPEDPRPDNYFVTRADIYGPEPSNLNERSEAWAALQAMVGLENVKDSITELLGRAKYNYQREIQGQASLQTSLNRVFLGPPGTGKTTVAQLYGQVISDLGLLSDGGVVMKTPGDFMSWKVGEAEEKAANILDGAQGKVLIIDEAHSLYHISGRGTNVTDRMRQGIIETIVAKVSGTPDEDRCVILTGYPHEMEEMFQNSNAGLRRRFPEEQTFHFRGYDEQQLGSILDSKLVDYGLGATEDAKRVARDVLNRMRVRPNFGHGGDVENLISRAKAEHRKRSLLPATEENDVPDFATNTNIILDPEDFDRDYTRTSSSESCRSLFRDFVGFEKIVSVFEGYQEMAVGMRLHGIDPRPHIPFAFVFKGPPGTGKTSTARKIGRVFYDLGFLSTDEVIECSATDLVGEWLGHTGPKVLNLLDKALGKVLFVDEAYRLNVGTRGLSGGSFHEEAISELVDAMTKPRYAQKMVIILAGYSKEMDRLMDGNPGLRGRFATHLVFPHMQPKHCLYHLMQEIGKLNIEIRDEDDPGDEKSKKVYKLFSRLSATKHWANGRDVESLARTVIAHVFRKQGRAAKKDRAASRPLTISTDELIQFLQDMLRERKGKNDEEQSGK